MWNFSSRRMCALMLTLGSPLPAMALCCPGDANIIISADSGIGQPQTSNKNLSLDSRWLVHAFERNAVSYFQVSDSIGNIQFIIGNTGEHFWLLPAGPAGLQVRLPYDVWKSSPMVMGVEVYRNTRFRLLVEEVVGKPVWAVESLPE